MADGDELPIHPAPMSTQSRQMLMIAAELELLRYRRPFDTRHPDEVDKLRKMLGFDVQPPAEPGHYYLVYVTTQDDDQVPVLIPEGEVRGFVFALAVKAGPDTGAQVLYMHGMLPR